MVVSGVPAVQPMGVSLFPYGGGQAVNFVDYGFIPTDIDFDSSSNLAAQTSSNYFTYLYIFGPLPFKLVLSGVMLRNFVTQSADGPTMVPYRPLAFLEWLATKLAASYSRRPVILVLNTDGLSPSTDSLAFLGYLINVRGQFTSDSDYMGLGKFVLTFMCVPPAPTS